MWSSLPSPLPFEAERRRWLSETQARAERRHPVQKFSSHSLLLLIDIELAFCAGAWLSVVVLCQACVEATLRQITTEDYKASAATLFAGNPDLQWLRQIRNEVLHAYEPGTPSDLWKLPSDNIVACHSALQAEAQRAVALAYEAVYVAAA